MKYDILSKIFNGLVSSETESTIVNKFETIADINILELGVDSLAIMELVFRMEEYAGIEIDYDNFKIEEIETPRLILNMLRVEKC